MFNQLKAKLARENANRQQRDLNWWHAEDGFMLRYGRRAQVIVRVVQEDSIYPNMWWVEFVDRTLSDISQPPRRTQPFATALRVRARARSLPFSD